MPGRGGVVDALVAIALEDGRRYASFAALLAAAEAGDAYAQGLLDVSARQVGLLVGDAITLPNPSVVAVSGMVLQLGTRYVDRVRATALSRAWLAGEGGPTIIPSTFGVLAGAVGSAALALGAFVYSTSPV